LYLIIKINKFVATWAKSIGAEGTKAEYHE